MGPEKNCFLACLAVWPCLSGASTSCDCLYVSQRILVARERHFGDKMGDINQSCPAETEGISYTPDNVGRDKHGHGKSGKRRPLSGCVAGTGRVNRYLVSGCFGRPHLRLTPVGNRVPIARLNESSIAQVVSTRPAEILDLRDRAASPSPAKRRGPLLIEE